MLNILESLDRIDQIKLNASVPLIRFEGFYMGSVEPTSARHSWSSDFIDLGDLQLILEIEVNTFPFLAFNLGSLFEWVEVKIIFTSQKIHQVLQKLEFDKRHLHGLLMEYKFSELWGKKEKQLGVYSYLEKDGSFVPFCYGWTNGKTSEYQKLLDEILNSLGIDEYTLMKTLLEKAVNNADLSQPKIIIWDFFDNDRPAITLTAPEIDSENNLIKFWQNLDIGISDGKIFARAKNFPDVTFDYSELPKDLSFKDPTLIKRVMILQANNMILHGLPNGRFIFFNLDKSLRSNIARVIKSLSKRS